MSTAIQGSKSINYNKANQGSYENSGDNMQHVTVQEMSGKRGGADVVLHGTTLVSTGKVVESGSAQRLIKSTAHGAQQGWIMRPSTGNSAGQEISIIKIQDADNFFISTPFDIAIGDTFDLLRFVTANYDASGNATVTVPAGSATAANQVLEIGLLTTIDADTGALAASITTEGGAQPANVLLVGGQNGAGIGRHFLVDSSGRLAVNVNTSALPTGAATAANQTTEIASLSSIDTKLTSQATAANQTTEIASLSSIDTKLTSQATAANQTAQSTLFGAVTETAPGTDTASSGLNGRLQRIAQRLSSIIALLPAALGQGTMAQSLRVVLPSDQVVNTLVATNTVGSQTKTTISSGGTATPTVPANATGFILKNAGDSEGDLCWEIGGAANGSSFDLTAGQGTAFVPCNATLSLFAKNGNVNYALQWLIK